MTLLVNYLAFRIFAGLLVITYSISAAAAFAAVAAGNPDPKKIQELRARMEFWESNLGAFYCEPPNIKKFPSKEEAKSLGNFGCDDGDMTLYNGLLCAAGVPEGCDAVERSQTLEQTKDNGRWWRSPRKVHSVEPVGAETKIQRTFGADQALGVWAYLAEKKNGERFRRWIAWMDRNPRCIDCLPTRITPRYCEDDNCKFGFIDCPLVNRLAEVLNERISLCSSVIPPAIPLPKGLMKRFNDVYDKAEDLSRRLHLPSPTDFLKIFSQLLAAYETAMRDFMKEVDKLGGSALLPPRLEDIIASINARFNKDGFSRHLAAVELFILKKYGFDNGTLNETAKKLAAKESKNPFFYFVAYGNKPPMLDLILGECPSEKHPSKKRFQWSWERDDKEKAWIESMYWDCIFVANLYLHGTTQLSARSLNSAPNPLLDHALQRLEDARWAIETLIRQVEVWLDHIPPTLDKCVGDIKECAKKLSPPPTDECLKDLIACAKRYPPPCATLPGHCQSFGLPTACSNPFDCQVQNYRLIFDKLPLPPGLDRTLWPDRRLHDGTISRPDCDAARRNHLPLPPGC